MGADRIRRPLALTSPGSPCAAQRTQARGTVFHPLLQGVARADEPRDRPLHDDDERYEQHHTHTRHDQRWQHPAHLHLLVRLHLPATRDPAVAHTAQAVLHEA
ncbi:hypothetical protein CFP66_29830 [Pseudonocardia sp. MH-G8]|nr:hypothetical protein CFP66_29830 [Pseudonocardia sp. MH-G8]